MSRRVALQSVAPLQTPVIDDTMLAPTLTQGEQSFIDKVKDLEARFTQPSATTKKTKKTTPKRRAFQPSDIVKGRGGVALKRGTTLKTLLTHMPLGKTPLLQMLAQDKLVNGTSLNKRTTLTSLVRQLPLSKKPLLDILGNKSL